MTQEDRRDWHGCGMYGVNNKGEVLGVEVTEGTGDQILLSHAVGGKVHGFYGVRSKARKLQTELTPSLSYFQRGIILWCD